MEKLEDIKEDYQKYKWFFTSSRKLVIGGKSAKQNDELIKRAQGIKKDLICMHTSEPGSPFSIILESSSKVTKKDLEECASFTASFSRAWRSGKRRAIVDIFKILQLYKDKKMKTGTWGVNGEVVKVSVHLGLVLAKQKGILRAIPEKSVRTKKSILLKITPGKVDKKDMLPKLHMELGEKYSQEEILAALPAGGIKISREK
mgnify:CR=1 FL=1